MGDIRGPPRGSVSHRTVKALRQQFLPFSRLRKHGVRRSILALSVILRQTKRISEIRQSILRHDRIAVDGGRDGPLDAAAETHGDEPRGAALPTRADLPRSAHNLAWPTWNIQSVGIGYTLSAIGGKTTGLSCVGLPRIQAGTAAKDSARNLPNERLKAQNMMGSRATHTPRPGDAICREILP